MSIDLEGQMGVTPNVRSREGSEFASRFREGSFVIFIAALLVSIYCRLSALNSRELWLDETYSVFLGNLRFSELLHRAAGDVHPPLYYVLLWVWIRTAGDAPAQLRLFGVILYAGAAVGMYLLARRTLGGHYGALAAILFAFSPLLFAYSLEVRMYMLLILVFVWLLTVHWMIVVEQNKANWLVAAYAVLAALLFFIHYVATFILVGLLLHWILASTLDRRRVLRLGITGLLTIVLISPGIPILLRQRAGKARMDTALRLSHRDPAAISFGEEAKPPEATGIAALRTSVGSMLGLYPATSFPLLLIFALPVVAALAGIAYLWLGQGDEVCRLFGAVGIGMALAVGVLHFVRARYMLALVPVLVMAIARVVQYGSTKPRWRFPSLACGLLIVCVYVASFSRQRLKQHGRPWENAVKAVQQSYSPGDQVIFEASYAQVPFDYVARRLDFQPGEKGFPISIYDWWNDQEFKGWGGPVIMLSDLDRFASDLANSKTNAVWLVTYEAFYYDPRGLLRSKLGQIGQVTEVSLPLDPDNLNPQSGPAIRLFRVSLR